MFKFRVKLSLIDDYIFICKVNNCYKNKSCLNDCFHKGIIELTDKLKTEYERIFFRLGYLNNSLSLLKEQISYSFFLDNAFFDDSESIILEKTIKILQKLKNINENMVKKMKKLTFNKQEIDYVLQKII